MIDGEGDIDTAISDSSGFSPNLNQHKTGRTLGIVLACVLGVVVMLSEPPPFSVPRG